VLDTYQVDQGGGWRAGVSRKCVVAKGGADVQGVAREVSSSSGRLLVCQEVFHRALSTICDRKVAAPLLMLAASLL
jgi:hypothetical protein